MSKPDQIAALKKYAQSIRDTLRSGPTNIEQALAPSFKNLLDDLLSTVPIGTGLHSVPEYAKQNIGRPDIALARQGQLPRAFVDSKRRRNILNRVGGAMLTTSVSLRISANCRPGALLSMSGISR